MLILLKTITLDGPTLKKKYAGNILWFRYPDPAPESTNVMFWISISGILADFIICAILIMLESQVVNIKHQSLEGIKNPFYNSISRCE